MNLKTLAFAALAATCSIAIAKDEHTPKHGGIVVEAKGMDLEIVATSEVLRVYVGDHGKPVKLDGGKATVTLLNGTEKSEFALSPRGDRFEADGTFKVGKGTKGIASVALPGKPAASARFEVK